MTLTVNLIERGHSDTPSIERVFAEVARGLEAYDVRTKFEKLPFGNGFVSMLRNLIGFRPSSADIFHITGHAHYIALALPAAKTVLTIHDTGILNLRTGLRRYALKKLLFDWPLKRLKYVTAISEATRTSVIEASGCDPQKIRVIGNPVPSGYTRVQKEFNASNPRILFIGTAPHKNLERAIAAMCGLRCVLHIVGELSVHQIRMLVDSGITYTNFASLDDVLMRQEYERADIVLFPSLFEGFGMPIIEAQAIGRPVVTSELSPMRDVAGSGGALFVDPHDPDDIRRSLDQLLSDEHLRLQLVEKGLENAVRFSCTRIARDYADLYRDLAKSEGIEG